MGKGVGWGETSASSVNVEEKRVPKEDLIRLSGVQ